MDETVLFKIKHLSYFFIYIPQTGCYARFPDLSIIILREPLLPIGGPDELGFGDSNNEFSTYENLKIYPTFTSGIHFCRMLYTFFN